MGEVRRSRLRSAAQVDGLRLVDADDGDRPVLVADRLWTARAGQATPSCCAPSRKVSVKAAPVEVSVRDTPTLESWLQGGGPLHHRIVTLIVPLDPSTVKASARTSWTSLRFATGVTSVGVATGIMVPGTPGPDEVDAIGAGDEA
jgi:hypothetical protein